MGEKTLWENTKHHYWAGQHGGLNMLGEIHTEIRNNPPNSNNTQPVQTSTVPSSTNIRPVQTVKDDVFIMTDSLAKDIHGD